MAVLWFAFMELTLVVGADNRATLLQMWYPPRVLVAIAVAIGIAVQWTQPI